LGVSFETQEFDNRPDNSESLLLRASLIYQLNNSFELQFGVINDTASGLSTRLSAGGAVDADAAIETIDVTENYVGRPLQGLIGSSLLSSSRCLNDCRGN
jgi:hypothetical protein